ncbi:MAG: tRNA 2-thiouridine(34) synthase MnmA [Acidobacteria bacterium]|nr:tRNA 2-thiouridine(34) synthase MnmA [Acidobacteriota bacterium]
MTSALRVAVAMSGGVDSSTAAAILSERGFDLVGFSMQLWDQRRGRGEGGAAGGRCCSLEDFHDARAVAARLGIPFYVVNFQREFERAVVRPFVQSYLSGLTPSPCVLCNSRLKFDHLLRLAADVHASAVATGHYARVVHDEASGRYQLLRARCLEKDQSYFLFELGQEQLARAMFPLGELRKQEVRAIARRHGLGVADKQESQEICFVPDGNYAAFVERYHADLGADGNGAKPCTPGQIVDVSGRVRGTHGGIYRYTIGQRRGLGIANPKPLYVVALDPDQQRVVVGERRELARKECRVVRPNWISFDTLSRPLRISAKIRSRHAEAPGFIEPLPDGSVRVIFDEPQQAVTPGQACVFYQGDAVVGGGWISRN